MSVLNFGHFIFDMLLLRQITNIRRLIGVALFGFAVMWNLPNANAGFTFTLGLLLQPWTLGNTTNVIEYSADGTFLSRSQFRP